MAEEVEETVDKAQEVEEQKPRVERTVTEDGKVDLDSMLNQYEGKNEEESSSEEEVVDKATQEEESKAETDKEEPTVKEEETPEAKEKEDIPKEEETPKAEEKKETTEEKSPEELDLNDYEVDFNGKNVPVQELLDKAKPAIELMERLEKDEWLTNVIKMRDSGQDVREYWEKSTIDYDKADAQSLLKEDFKSTLPEDTDPKRVDRLWKKELKNKYGLDIDADQNDEDFDSEAFEDAKLYLERDAKKIREQKKEDQKKFKFPEPKEQVKQEEVSEEDRVKQEVEQLKQIREQVESIDDIKKFKSEKIIPIKLGEETFNLEVDNPDEVIETIADDRNFYALFKDDKGNTDWGKLQRVVRYAQDEQNYLGRVAEHVKNQTLEEELKEEKNIPALNKGASASRDSEEDPLLAAIKAGKYRKVNM